MLPLLYRLPLRGEEEFFIRAQRSSSSALTLWYLIQQKNEVLKEQKMAQGAVIVAKTTAKRATQRNRLKRQLRELLLPYLKARQNSQFVLQARKPSMGKNFTELKNELQQLMERVAN